jgi:hypothetical protein
MRKYTRGVVVAVLLSSCIVSFASDLLSAKTGNGNLFNITNNCFTPQQVRLVPLGDSNCNPRLLSIDGKTTDAIKVQTSCQYQLITSSDVIDKPILSTPAKQYDLTLCNAGLAHKTA